MDDFCNIICPCHTVFADRNADGTISYQAASPDEGALVEAARKIGYEFVSRGLETLVMRVDGVERTLKVSLPRLPPHRCCVAATPVLG